MQHSKIFATALTALLVLVLTGCKNPDAKYTKVEGTITYKGEPVSGATVQFQSVIPEGESATGITDANGKYTLSSTQAKEGGRGALPGDYSVIVRKIEPSPPDPDQEAYEKNEIDYNELQARLARRGPGATSSVRKSLVPEKYKDAKTPLKATVKPGKNDPFDYTLED